MRRIILILFICSIAYGKNGLIDKPSLGVRPSGGVLSRDLFCAWLINEGSGDLQDSAYPEYSLVRGTGAEQPGWALGENGYALSFDGGDLASGSSIGTISLPVTIVAYFKFDSAGSNEAIFASHDSTNVYYGVILAKDSSNNIWLTFGDGGGNLVGDRRTKTGGTALSANTWYHIVAVIRGAGDMDIYVNGRDDGGSYSGSGTAMDSSAGIPKLGRLIATGIDWNLTGDIDHVMLYKRELSANEAEILYRDNYHIFKKGFNAAFAANASSGWLFRRAKQNKTGGKQ